MVTTSKVEVLVLLLLQLGKQGLDVAVGRSPTSSHPIALPQSSVIHFFFVFFS